MSIGILRYLQNFIIINQFLLLIEIYKIEFILIENKII